MIHYNYSARQLESEAEKLLFRFDPERLKKPKSIDVYAVIEKCLGVEYDWKYITPDQSILGATAFNAGYIWVWPEPCYREGMLPSKVYLPKGCILIDATLTDPKVWNSAVTNGIFVRFGDVELSHDEILSMAEREHLNWQ